MYKKHKQYRLYGFDYSQTGSYFITIVTKNRLHYFGNIADNCMHLSAIGNIANENILKFVVDRNNINPFINNPYFINDSPHIFSIDEHVVMPNHLHLIVEIINRVQKDYHSPVGLQPLQSGAIGTFINHFKGKIKRLCNEKGLNDFRWQSRFNDRIIRDADEYQRIAQYIRNNVFNWQDDEENM